jgi:sugar phosphate isomerase/epimerase
LKFAVFTVSTPDYSPAEIVTRIKQAGYDGIEWRVTDEAPDPKGTGFWAGNKSTLPFSTFAEKAREYKQLTDDAGLEVPSLGSYVSCDDITSVEYIMKAAASIGISMLRVRLPNYDNSLPYNSLFESSREQYKLVAELAGRYNVKALVELHHRTICPSASSARLFLDGFNPAEVGVIHDAGNMVFEGFEAYRLGFETLGPFLAHVHVKNARWFPVRYLPDGGVEWKADFAPVSKGVADLRALMQSLEAIGYDEWIAFEDFSTDRPLDDRLTSNLDYVTTLWAESIAAAVDMTTEPVDDRAPTATS